MTTCFAGIPLFRRVWMMIQWSAFSVGLASCATKPAEHQAGLPLCRYTATSRVTRSVLPTKIYVFPTLLSDTKGNPKEKLAPALDPSGGITDWSAPSAKSKLIRGQIERRLKSLGYQVVPFQDVLAMQSPHSILMLSSFYTAPVPVDHPKQGQPDQCILTMIKASTFALDLNPKNGKNLTNIDGATLFYSGQNVSQLEQESFSELIGWLGDSVSGVAYLKR
jgi:hypothetical protein